MHDAKRQGALLIVRQKHDRVEELIPQDDEIERDGGEKGRHTDRQGDAPEDLEIRISVEPCRIEEVLRDLREEALENIDRHREMAGDVDDDEAGQRVVEPVIKKDLEQRKDQQLRRQDHAGQDDEAHETIAAKAVARKTMRDHRADDRQQRDRGHDDDGAVPEIGAVIGFRPGLDELLPMETARQRIGAREDFGCGAQRHHRHPQERSSRYHRVDRHESEERRASEIGRPFDRMRSHAAQNSSLSRCRSMCVSARMKARMMRNQSTAIAEG